MKRVVMTVVILITIAVFVYSAVVLWHNNPAKANLVYVGIDFKFINENGSFNIWPFKDKDGKNRIWPLTKKEHETQLGLFICMSYFFGALTLFAIWVIWLFLNYYEEGRKKIKTKRRESGKEFYQKGMLNSDIAKIIKKDFKGYLIWADCAEPKSIYELQIYGCKVMPVKKGKDSVIHGIEWLKQWQIIVDKRCKHTIQELQGYTYVKDKNGNVTNQPIPINDHCIDSLRYATEKTMIYTRSMLGLKASDLGV